jgi:hypothetical protein
MSILCSFLISELYGDNLNLHLSKYVNKMRHQISCAQFFSISSIGVDIQIPEMLGILLFSKANLAAKLANKTSLVCLNL